MNWEKILYSFQFNNQFIRNNNIHTITSFQLYIFLKYRQWYLTLNIQTQFVKLIVKALFIYGFK